MRVIRKRPADRAVKRGYKTGSRVELLKIAGTTTSKSKPKEYPARRWELSPVSCIFLFLFTYLNNFMAALAATALNFIFRKPDNAPFSRARCAFTSLYTLLMASA